MHLLLKHDDNNAQPRAHDLVAQSSSRNISIALLKSPSIDILSAGIQSDVNVSLLRENNSDATTRLDDVYNGTNHQLADGGKCIAQRQCNEVDVYLDTEIAEGNIFVNQKATVLEARNNHYASK